MSNIKACFNIIFNHKGFDNYFTKPVGQLRTNYSKEY